MKITLSSLLSPTNSVALLALTSFATLAGAWFFQLVIGLQPCQLCYYGRWHHYAILLIGVVFLLLPLSSSIRPPLARNILIFFSMLSLAGAFLSLYHVGVELHWWKGLEGCSAGSLDEALSTDPLALLDEMPQVSITRCDEIPWMFLGVSMAGWNGLISLSMALYAAMSFVKSRKL